LKQRHFFKNYLKFYCLVQQKKSEIYIMQNLSQKNLTAAIAYENNEKAALLAVCVERLLLRADEREKAKEKSEKSARQARGEKFSAPILTSLKNIISTESAFERRLLRAGGEKEVKKNRRTASATAA